MAGYELLSPTSDFRCWGWSWWWWRRYDDHNKDNNDDWLCIANDFHCFHDNDDGANNDHENYHDHHAATSYFKKSQVISIFLYLPALAAISELLVIKGKNIWSTQRAISKQVKWISSSHWHLPVCDRLQISSCLVLSFYQLLINFLIHYHFRTSHFSLPASGLKISLALFRSATFSSLSDS